MTRKDKCDSCGQKFGEHGKDNFMVTRFDNSDICTHCQVFDSQGARPQEGGMIKPKRTSITVTVRNGDNFRATRPGRTYEGDGIIFDYIKEFFPKTPKPPYRLTYRLNTKGALVVCDKENGGAAGVDRLDSTLGPATCFLTGLGWHGLRVTRTVEAIRPKRGKK